MGIKIKLGKGNALTGRIVHHYPACDYCGEEITPDTPANIESEEKEGAPVYFLHKDCSSRFRKGKPRMLWSDFGSLTIKAK